MFNQSEYNKQYRKNNADKIKQQQTQWHKNNPNKKKEYAYNYRLANKKLINYNNRIRRKNNPEKFRTYEKIYRESSISRVLSHKYSQLKKEKHHNKKSIKYKNTITLKYLIDLWNEQNGVCAITNKPMSFKKNNLYTVSIDRIDSNIGYFEGNIQLVCKAINLAKGQHTNNEIIEFWADTTQTVKMIQ